jgi:hypothetical protein
LLEWRRYPAGELLALYARRWEQELFYKELKVDMRSTPCLQASILASTSGLLRKVGVSDGAALPLALGGAGGFILLITIRFVVSCCAASAVFAKARR